MLHKNYKMKSQENRVINTQREPARGVQKLSIGGKPMTEILFSVLLCFSQSVIDQFIYSSK